MAVLMEMANSLEETAAAIPGSLWKVRRMDTGNCSLVLSNGKGIFPKMYLTATWISAAMVFCSIERCISRAGASNVRSAGMMDHGKSKANSIRSSPFPGLPFEKVETFERPDGGWGA